MTAPDAVLAIGYVVATVLGRRAATITATECSGGGPSSTTAHDDRRLARLWFATTIILVLFGLNRALGTHEWLLDRLRGWASTGGWYLERRRVQRPLVIGLLMVGIVIAGAVCWIFRRVMRRAAGPLVGVTLLVLYVATRLVSLHSIDVAFSTWPVAVSRAVECSGLALIAASALIARRGPRRGL